MIRLTFILLLFSFVFSCSSAKKQAQKEKTNVVVSRSESEGEYFFIKGMGAYFRDDFRAAANYYEKALKFSPNNSAIYYKLGEVYYNAGSTKEGKQYIEKAIAIDGDNPAYHLLLIRMHLALKEYNLASNAYKKMFSANPSLKEHHLEAAHWHKRMAQSEPDKQQTYLRDAVHYFDKHESYSGVVEEVVIEKVNIYMHLKDNANAEKELRKLIAAYPENTEYPVKLAHFWFMNGEKEKAISYLEQCLEEDSQEYAYHIALAELHKLNGNTQKSDKHLMAVFDNPDYSVHNKVKIISGLLQSNNEGKHLMAMEMAKKTASVHSDYPQAHAILGDAYLVNSQKEAAREAYLKSVEIDSAVYLVWEQIVYIDAQLQQYDDLIKDANACLKQHPDKPAVLYYLGIAHVMQENYVQAERALAHGERQVQNNPILQFQFLSQLGDVYHSLELHAKSDSVFEKALEYDPNNVHVLNNYSYFLSLRGENLQQAKAMSGKVLKIHPNDPTYLDTYAWVLYKLADYVQAEKLLSQALKSSDDAAILEHYGDVLYQLGRKEEAKQYWKKAQGGKGTSQFLDKKIKDGTLYE